MADYETIAFAQSDGVARITFNRPDKLNSFNVQMHQEVRDALRSAEHSASVVVLTGAGRAFSAGQDLGERSPREGHSVDLGFTVETAWNPLIRRIANMPQPVIAKVNGVAAGAGANVAFACDIVVAAQSAKFIQSFSALGLVPDSGGSWILPRLVGPARALALALTGEPVQADTAADWGLIWKCVEDEALDAEVDALATKLAGLPPLGLAATKKLMRSTWSRTLEEELNEERNEMRRLGYSEDYREGVAAFLEKRTPTFVGR